MEGPLGIPCGSKASLKKDSKIYSTMNGFKVILKSPMMAVVMTITSLLFIRFLLKYNSSRNIVLCEWNKHTFSCYFPLSIRTRLVLSFEFDNICSVNIHISYDNKEHEHIWRLQQQQKNQKNKHCYRAIWNTCISIYRILSLRKYFFV